MPKRKRSGSAFGKSSSRTKEQLTHCKEYVSSLLKTFQKDALLCFTDGACKGNPGPGGSGFVVLQQKGKDKKEEEEEEEEEELLAWEKKNRKACQQFRVLKKDSHHVGSKTTNNVSELTAISRALTYFESMQPLSTPIHLLTDSRYCEGLFIKHHRPSVNVELIRSIQVQLETWNSQVQLHWIPGHTDCLGNDWADALANHGILSQNSK